MRSENLVRISCTKLDELHGLEDKNNNRFVNIFQPQDCFRQMREDREKGRFFVVVVVEIGYFSCH